jgi:quercetin dioxygenase-like cupin family protein
VSSSWEQARLREQNVPPEDVHPYEVLFADFETRRARSSGGDVVIKGRDLRWQQSRQGRSKYYLHHRNQTAALEDWYVFAKEVQTESGAHIHQGGLVIYVSKGRGYSVFDGVRLDWKPGDLLILPVKPGGVEHQHFNLDESAASEWIAFIFLPLLHATGSMLTQVKEQTNWQSAAAGTEFSGALDGSSESDE